MEKISSRENPVIKTYRSLAASARERREQGLIVLEGQRLCCDAAAAGAAVSYLLLTEEALERFSGMDTLMTAAEKTLIITPALAQSISQTKTNQGVFCICKMPEHRLPDLQKGGSFLLLDRLQDPGNMGTIIRCAEAFGISAVVVTRDSADIWSPKVLRSTMGSCFRQIVVECDDLTEVISSLEQARISVYAATLDKDSVTPQRMSAGEKGIGVVVGNEGNGVSAEIVEKCSKSVYIPMTPQIESLNAASAAAVLMWELCGRAND